MSQRVDLLPGGYRARDIVKERLLRWTVVICFCVVVVAVAGFLFKWQAAKLDTRVTDLRTHVAVMKSWEQMVLPLAADLEAVSKQRVVVNELLAEPNWSALMTDIANAAPDDLQLTGLTAERSLPAGDGDTPAKPAFTALVIQGRAPSNAVVFHFVKNLSQSRQLRNVTLKRSNVDATARYGPTILFEVQAVLGRTRPPENQAEEPAS